MEFIVGTLIILTGFIVLGRAVDPVRRLAKRKVREISSLGNFSPSVRFDHPVTQVALMIDASSNRFAIWQPEGGANTFDFVQLVAVEVVRDGASLQRSNRGSQIAGAAVGGVLLGPVGMLLGGLTGSKRTENRVRRIALKLFLSDLAAPVREVVFLDVRKPLRIDHPQVQMASRQLDEWHGRFQTILRGALKNDVAPDVIPATG